MAPVALDSPPHSPETFRPKQAAKVQQPSVRFDASKHLSYSPPASVLTMKDLALETTPLSPIATTDPFPLLSHEAVLAHRAELFSPSVLDNCMHSTRPGSVQLRGMAPRYAPFIHQFWNSPELLKIVSDLAGVELVPVMDYETSHANVQVGPGGIDGIRATPVEPPAATEEAIREFKKDKPQKRDAPDQDKVVVEWHKDSHPWVCVVMLSDARNMVGGETELMKGDGTTIKVKAPQMGCAILLQGRYIDHIALPADNMPERITIVTSFRPKNPLLIDESTNVNTRKESHLTELYYQWTTYRLDVMAQRIQAARDALREKYEKNVKETDPEGKPGLCKVETVNVEEMQKWSDDMVKYINTTMYEMRPLEEYELKLIGR